MSSADLAVAASGAAVWPPVLAVDPGSTSTGVCLRVGTSALEAVTVTRNGGEEGDGDHRAACRYAMTVIETAREITRRQRDALNETAAERGVSPGPLRHAVETLVAPTGTPVKGRRAAVAPRVLASLPTASTVLGCVIGTWPRAILVPPRGGSKGGWDAVPGSPESLRGRTPTGWMRGGEDRSHQRSAFMIAGVAHVQTAPPLPEQVQAAVKAAGRPALDAEHLVPHLRAAIAQAGAWDLLSRLPSLAAAVAARVTGDRERAEQIKAEVTQYLEEEH